MEIATPACHHREEFQSQIRARIVIADLCRLIAQLQAIFSSSEYDNKIPRCIVAKRIILTDGSCFASPQACWVDVLKACTFTLAQIIQKCMDPSFSVQKKIMLCNNGRILVADSTDGYHEYVWQTPFNIVKGICTILAYLHEQLKSRICHLDVKPANMLLDCNMVAKITDFGLAMCMRQERTLFNISTGTNGIVKYNGSIVLADRIVDSLQVPADMIPYRLLCNMYLDDDEYHGLDGSTRVNIRICTRLLILLFQAVCSKRSEMSPEEFSEIVHQNLRNRSKFESSSKQIRRLNQIVLNCLETVKSTMAMNRLVSSTQRRAAISGTVYTTVLNTMQAYITALNMASVDLVLDSDGSALAAAPSMHQHLYRNNLADERSDKPRSNSAPATNSSDDTTRAPMANKLTYDETENHSDPNSCIVERDTIEEAKRSGEWCVATGAAHHTTWNRDLITNMEELENDGIYVHAADGTPMPVRGRGNVVTDDVVLPDVYYVPGLCTNLVSVGQLAGLDYCVGFSRGACVISSATGTVVGRAHARGDGLYELDFLRVPLDMP